MMKLEMNFETKILKQKKSRTKENEISRQIVKWSHLILLWGRPEVGFVGCCMTMELGFDGVTDAKAFFFASVS